MTNRNCPVPFSGFIWTTLRPREHDRNVPKLLRKQACVRVRLIFARRQKYRDCGPSNIWCSISNRHIPHIECWCKSAFGGSPKRHSTRRPADSGLFSVTRRNTRHRHPKPRNRIHHDDGPVMCGYLFSSKCRNWTQLLGKKPAQRRRWTEWNSQK